MNQCPPQVIVAESKQGKAVGNLCPMLYLQGAAMPPKAARPEAQPAHVHQHQQQERPAEQARRGEQVGVVAGSEHLSDRCLASAHQH